MTVTSLIPHFCKPSSSNAGIDQLGTVLTWDEECSVTSSVSKRVLITFTDIFGDIQNSEEILFFIIAKHTGPNKGVMVRGAISFYNRTRLKAIRDTLTAQRYVDEILRPVVLPILLHHLCLTFQQGNALRHTARLAMNCLQASTNISLPNYSYALISLQ
ncbi:hypothetical protein AVEN_178943-1 [Araneus ventricosus]|uniref:Uncharacterized protein n=1 Tax=Araneus ventricosus TaxID=182803 RepID=A0A4Y2RQS3_ARAVE|nr:hypothetical protein AVEN_245942-1 [Araneus ventricosus]GBN78207.1 hypothetical protein AVEN_178943-1 [Araneus ventricosus]